MGELVRFVSKSERERVRLVREARAIYDSIFPSADRSEEQQHRVTASHMVNDATADRNDGTLCS
jgi:hypothetical protein